MQQEQESGQQQEDKHFNILKEYERKQKALEAMAREEEKKRQEEKKKTQDRCKQMVELKLREDEVCGFCRSCYWGNQQYCIFVNILS